MGRVAPNGSDRFVPSVRHLISSQFRRYRLSSLEHPPAQTSPVRTLDARQNAFRVIGSVGKVIEVVEVVGAKGFEPSTSWSRTTLVKQSKALNRRRIAEQLPPLIVLLSGLHI